MNYDYYLFDADDTLFDFAKSEIEAFNSTLKEFGIKEQADKLYQTYKSENDLLWKKLEQWVQDLRHELDDPAAFEWFQWLAMTLQSLQDDTDNPAYEAHTDWKPSNLSSEI